jgi:DnaJ-class molecular chaperone
MSHSKIITPAKRLFTKLFGDDDFDMSAADCDDEENSDDEGGYCTACSGSGEGMFDGSRCSTCRGSGDCA